MFTPFPDSVHKHHHYIQKRSPAHPAAASQAWPSGLPSPRPYAEDTVRAASRSPLPPLVGEVGGRLPVTCALPVHTVPSGAVTGHRIPAASWHSSDPHPTCSSLPCLGLLPPTFALCVPALRSASRAPRAGAHVCLPPAGLASSPGTRGAWPPRSGARTARSPSASGPAPTGTTATRSKDRRPCSTCEPAAALGPAPEPGTAVPATAPGGPGLSLAHPSVQVPLRTEPSDGLSAPRKHMENLPNSPEMRVDGRPSV